MPIYVNRQLSPMVIAFPRIVCLRPKPNVYKLVLKTVPSHKSLSINIAFSLMWSVSLKQLVPVASNGKYFY